MSLSKVNSFTDAGPNYLDLDNLIEGGHYETVSLIVNHKTGIDRTSKGFVTLYAKDVKGRVVSCQIFNIADFYNSGISAGSLKNKPVKLKFIASKFAGRWSLLVDEGDGVAVWEKQFNRELFMDKISCDVDTVRSVVGYYLPYTVNFTPYENSSFIDICQGAVGGFMKLYEVCITKLSTHNNLPLFDMDHLVKIFDATMTCYYRFLYQKESAEYLTNNSVYILLEQVSQNYENHPLRLFIMDSTRAMLGMGKPETIYGNLIYNSVQDTLRDFELLYVHNSMILGARTSVGGADLLRY